MKTLTLKIRPTTTVAELTKSSAITELNHGELVVYLQLVSASAEHGMTMTLRNCDLHSDPRTARRALIGLQKRGVVRIRYKRGDSSERTVELVA